jgi:hypothetical protein
MHFKIVRAKPIEIIGIADARCSLKRF